MTQLRSDHTPTLESVQEQFKAWRAGKTGREPIPEHLWAAAARLCQDYPLTRVSRVLRLSFNDLKKHLPERAPVQFTELDIRPLAGSWEIECQRPDGARLRLSSTGPLPDLSGLLRGFLP
jgi:hypothetical protein